MKTNVLKFTTLCSLFFAISTQIFAQETKYQSVFGKISTSYNLYNFRFAHIYADSAYFVKDTLLNSIEYKKFNITRRSELFPSENRSLGTVLLRESEDHSKLYCFYPNENTEYLLMDLNLEIQDTLYLEHTHTNWAVRSVSYDNDGKKRIILHKIDESDWILRCVNDGVEFREGIGPTLFVQIENYRTCLQCVHKDNIKVFGYSECFYEWVDPRIGDIGEKHLFNNNLKIHPNPAKDFIEIDFGETFSHYQSVYVYDVVGSLCLSVPITQEKQQFNVQGLPAGYYTIQVKGKDKQSVYEKLIIIN